MKENTNESTSRLARRLRRQHYQHAEFETGITGASELAHEAASPVETHEHHHPKAAELEKTVEGLREQLLRAQAEFDNYRKRQRREEQQRIEQANQRLVEQLLPVLDNFKRALQNPGDSVQGLLAGVEMVNKQMQDVLTQQGLVTINPAGQPFDPNQHEAVAVEQTTDKPDNEVTEVFQEGYALKGRLLRPAMVKVARN